METNFTSEETFETKNEELKQNSYDNFNIDVCMMKTAPNTPDKVSKD